MRARCLKFHVHQEVSVFHLVSSIEFEAQKSHLFCIPLPSHSLQPSIYLTDDRVKGVMSKFKLQEQVQVCLVKKKRDLFSTCGPKAQR